MLITVATQPWIPIKNPIKQDEPSKELHNKVSIDNMKFAVLLLLSILGLFEPSAGSLDLPQEIIDLLKGASATCKEETGIPQEMIDEMRRARVPDDPRAKCYLKCLMMQLQAMNEEGNLEADLIEAGLPDVIKEHGGVETLHKCKHIHESDFCETAYKFVLCLKNENPELAAMFE